MIRGPHSLGRSVIGPRTLGLLLLWAAGSCGREPAEPPGEDCNVILVSADTLRADRLNCYGYTKRKLSPNIDGLACDGILFENHIAASPWTTPAHLSMLTSLYPSAHRVTQSFNELKEGLLGGAVFNSLPAARTTLAEALRDRGYATAAFTGGITLHPDIGFGQGFELYDTSMYKLHAMNTGAMFEWIRRQARRRFFLFWHHFEVHAPYLQTDFLPEALPEDAAALVGDELGRLTKRLVWHVPSISEHQATTLRLQGFLRRHQSFTPQVCEALYAGGVRSADRWFGELIDRLRGQGLYDKSLIIFTSDHGEEFADHQQEKFYGAHGHSLYDEVLKVPLIIKLPHQQHAGTRVRSPARMIDLMPTILDLLGIDAAREQMQGSSLRPLWEQPGRQEDRIAVSESLYRREEKKGLRTARYKYILSIDPAVVARYGRAYLPEQARRVELYDLQRDPGEKVNLLRSGPGDYFLRLAAPMEQHLREHVRVKGPAPEQIRLDAETVENLKALGYIR